MARPLSQRSQDVIGFITSLIEEQGKDGITRKLAWYNYRVSNGFNDEVNNIVFSQIIKVALNQGLLRVSLEDGEKILRT